jgi:hypothetical protein
MKPAPPFLCFYCFETPFGMLSLRYLIIAYGY